MRNASLASVGLKLFENWLPNIGTTVGYDLLGALLKGATVTDAVAGANGGVSPGVVVTFCVAVLGSLGISWYSGRQDKRQAEEIDEQLRTIIRQGGDETQRIRDILGGLGAELTVDHNELMKRLNGLSEILKATKTNSERTVELLQSQEGLFISLETFVLENVQELKVLMGAQHEEIVGLLKKQPPLELRLVRETTASLHQELFYGARQVKLIGRDKVMGELKEFCSYRDGNEPKFRWWMMTGSGGVGKSRLGLELCLWFRQNGVAGFLSKDGAPFEDWREWQPRHPTLIVVDYVMQRAQGVGEMVRILTWRTDLEHPVRILLLERQESDTWMKELTGAGGDEVITRQKQYQGGDGKTPTLTIAGLGEEDVWAIFQQVCEKFGAKDPDRNLTLEAFRRIDPQSRPLFALMAADAVARNASIRAWDTEELLKWVLNREEERWVKLFGEDEERRKKYIHLLVLATMTLGLAKKSYKDLIEKYSMGEFLPKRTELDPSVYEALVGSRHAELWPGMEPDILGEYLVLTHFSPDGRFADFAGEFINAAWNTTPVTAFFFVDHAVLDFPMYPSITTLSSLPENHTHLIRELWALTIMDHISAFGKAREWAGAQMMYAKLATFAAAYSDEANVRLAQAKGAFNLISDLGEAGEVMVALKYLDELAILAARHPEDAAVRLVQAEGAYNLIIDLSKAGEVAAAQKVYADLATLAARYPNEVAVRLEQAQGAFNLISALGGAGEVKAAQAVYEELAALAARYPNEVAVRLALAKSAFNLINALTSARNNTIAQKVDEELATQAVEHSFIHGLMIVFHLAIAQKIYDELAALAVGHPDDREVRLEHAKGAFNLSYVLSRLGDIKTAQLILTDVVTAADWLVEQYICTKTYDYFEVMSEYVIRAYRLAKSVNQKDMMRSVLERVIPMIESAGKPEVINEIMKMLDE